jgi:hypothetical protein
MYDMAIRSDERVELRTPAGRKARWQKAAERAGISLSDWARRRLDDVAERELHLDEPPAPSSEDVKAALKARGALKGHMGAVLRKRVHEARKTP